MFEGHSLAAHYWRGEIFIIAHKYDDDDNGYDDNGDEERMRRYIYRWNITTGSVFKVEYSHDFVGLEMQTKNAIQLINLIFNKFRIFIGINVALSSKTHFGSCTFTIMTLAALKCTALICTLGAQQNSAQFH